MEPGGDRARLDDTVSAWQSWSDVHQAYVGPWRDLVHHSGRVLQALSFQPTGAICAAATTSLPEVVGGTRNWDYRYAWVRDASFTIEALWVAACPDEANEFFDYMTTSAAGSLEAGDDLQIMFGIGGERDLSERELPHLSGWRNSAPVRVGNDAWRQRQLDVYGEVLNAVHRLSDRLFDPRDAPSGTPFRGRQVGRAARARSEHSSFLVALADTGCRALAGKGSGHLGDPRRAAPLRLLEADVLGGARRATELADHLGASHRVQAWAETQDQIRQAILNEGWSDRPTRSRNPSALTTSTPRT